MIYIGSGTDSRGGVASRFYSYDTKAELLVHIERALNDGYTIVKKGLICWCPVPTAVKRFPIRALFLVIEASFAFVFWAIRSRTKDYGMAQLCLWSREQMEYDGCCSHSAL
jgi:hypothetical protein